MGIRILLVGKVMGGRLGSRRARPVVTEVTDNTKKSAAVVAVAVMAAAVQVEMVMGVMAAAMAVAVQEVVDHPAWMSTQRFHQIPAAQSLLDKKSQPKS